MCLLCSLTVAQVKKTTIAVISLKGSSGVTQDEADLLSDRLRVDLFNTGSVDVMEREQMQTVLKEQGFQKSGACTDEGCLVEIGQILGVQKLITGSIGKIGSIYLVNARVIDIKTAKITKSFSEDVKGSLENVVERLPKIAVALCDSQVQTSEKGSKPAQQEAQPEHALDCSGKIFVERIEFPQSAIGFTLPPRDWAFVYDKLVDGLKSSFSKELRTASSEQVT
jgi:TolB-like protein